MSLLAIPNVSEGADRGVIDALRGALSSSGSRVLDVHSDPIHGRSVFTVAGSADQLVEGLTSLASLAAQTIDLTKHHGVHPRLGALDVCPLVPSSGSMTEAIETARLTGRAIGERAGLPVYLYGAAATRQENEELPALRRGGLEGLMSRSREGLIPDFGPREIEPTSGVVCVGARDVLVAFNVWVEGALDVLADVARKTREQGLVRALGLRLDAGRGQISMNLIEPDLLGIDGAFARVEDLAGEAGLRIVGTEIVGLVPERFLPDPDAKAARLLIAPGRSLESQE
ncbi:MAG: glutamate formiminotransferase / 5-formyltetrahydrofolate cyclo-ligase [Actinomycetota bacterium]|jgi:glutamate formiminotransferase|nr:glutamate formiminotransferase / 5-formyltetrahydrofolate cyclo-ligase [Actinomycetota bacterium]